MLLETFKALKMEKFLKKRKKEREERKNDERERVISYKGMISKIKSPINDEFTPLLYLLVLFCMCSFVILRKKRNGKAEKLRKKKCKQPTPPHSFTYSPPQRPPERKHFLFSE